MILRIGVLQQTSITARRAVSFASLSNSSVQGGRRQGRRSHLRAILITQRTITARGLGRR